MADVDELRSLVKDHLIPRLDSLENEVILLRELCWPVCQALTEHGDQLSYIKRKAIFLSQLHVHDRRTLLARKASMIRKLDLGAGNLCPEEDDTITRTIAAPPRLHDASVCPPVLAPRGQ
jgi:hypothetical protein